MPTARSQHQAFQWRNTASRTHSRCLPGGSCSSIRPGPWSPTRCRRPALVGAESDRAHRLIGSVRWRDGPLPRAHPPSPGRPSVWDRRTEEVAERTVQWTVRTSPRDRVRFGPECRALSVNCRKGLCCRTVIQGLSDSRRRIESSSVPVELVGLDGQSIPLPDDSCDDALCTFTLCTIPDVNAALAEVLRVLRPGGRFHFLEHGLAPDAGVAAWQRRLEPLQRRLADGCHLTRDPVELVRGSGFILDDVDQRYGVGPKPWSWFTRGVAVKPG